MQSSSYDTSQYLSRAEQSQTFAKDAIMEKCSACKVARYCSRAHNRMMEERAAMRQGDVPMNEALA